MGRLLRGLIFLGVAAGLALGVLKRTGLLTGGECGPACPCSLGNENCDCGHPTCLSPAAGA